MYTKTNSLTHEEYIRLNEIIFYNFIHNLFTLGKNPTKIFNFVEVVCLLTTSNLTILNSVVLTVLQEDLTYAPRRKEHIALLSKAAVPVRKICKQFSLSNTTYYKLMEELKTDPILIKPKYKPAQYEEIIKFLDAIDMLAESAGRS